MDTCNLKGVNHQYPIGDSWSDILLPLKREAIGYLMKKDRIDGKRRSGSRSVELSLTERDATTEGKQGDLKESNCFSLPTPRPTLHSDLNKALRAGPVRREWLKAAVTTVELTA
ncbi:hypothetical protein EVAR_22186_1 [Eumeta japonica]|uniref:Uncharacterized protein n=1 Tax=Eumeta variegata TaxID=151549 RepID=A0A4C1XYL1_EUMVA|nr:hypothetical protein EVAR_22186_1 [Eumeta japonica]